MNWHEYVMDLEFSFQCIKRQILSHRVNWPEFCNIFIIMKKQKLLKPQKSLHFLPENEPDSVNVKS